MSTLLRHGSLGQPVCELQASLNGKLRPSPGLVVDGHFGPRTLAALRRFQIDHWLEVDGVAGPCTQSALFERDRYVIVCPPTRLVPQPTPTTCWAAATGMLLGRAGPVTQVPLGMNTANGLPNDSDLDNPTQTTRFAAFHGLRLLPGQSWMPEGLANLMRTHARLMVNTLWDAAAYTRRRTAGWEGSSGHMRIFAGIRGDGTVDGTTIRVYDPWPPNQGAIYSIGYGRMMREVPATTYQIYYR